MKVLLILTTTLLIFTCSKAQNPDYSEKYMQRSNCAALIIDSYFSYQLIFDTCLKKNFIYNTIKKTELSIDYPYNDSPYRTKFRYGFVQVRVADMQGLMTFEGKHLIEASLNCLYYDEKNNIISANDFWGHKWIFLNFKGEVLSQGACAGGSNFHYIPKLDSVLNIARVDTIISRSKELILYGYLNQDARWAIQPRFEDAKDFVGEFAMVKLNGKWGMINKQGEFVINANYDSPELVPTPKKRTKKS